MKDGFQTKVDLYRRVLGMARESQATYRNLRQGVTEQNMNLVQVDMAYYKGASYSLKAVLSTIALDISEEFSTHLKDLEP